MKAYKFKNPDEVINVGGLQVTQWNMTEDIYNYLVLVSPEYSNTIKVENVITETVKPDKKSQ